MASSRKKSALEKVKAYLETRGVAGRVVGMPDGLRPGIIPEDLPPHKRGKLERKLERLGYERVPEATVEGQPGSEVWGIDEGAFAYLMAEKDKRRRRVTAQIGGLRQTAA